MSFNQFLGLGGFSSGGGGVGGGGRGPKGDPGSFIWSFGNPPNLDEHLRLTDDDLLVFKPLVPSLHDTVDVGAADARFRTVYSSISDTQSVRYNSNIYVSYDTDGTHRIRVGDEHTVFGVTTLQSNPDKIDPKYIDFTGLRFIDVISGNQNLETLITERPLLQPGDYFVVNSEGTFNYDHFDDVDNVASRGDILVFTLERFFKVPFRIPNHSIATTHLSDASITSTKLTANCVQSEHLAEGAVGSTKLEDNLQVKSLEVTDNLVAHSFCSNERVETTDAMENQTFGITFANRGQVSTGTWRIKTSIESLMFEIWNGTRWVNKFELR